MDYVPVVMLANSCLKVSTLREPEEREPIRQGHFVSDPTPPPSHDFFFGVPGHHALHATPVKEFRCEHGQFHIRRRRRLISWEKLLALQI